MSADPGMNPTIYCDVLGLASVWTDIVRFHEEEKIKTIHANHYTGCILC